MSEQIYDFVNILSIFKIISQSFYAGENNEFK